MTGNNGGRPPKLTKDIQDGIVTALKMGNHLETAAAYNGLDASTVRRWMARGKREMQRVEAVKGSNIKKSEVLYVEFCAVVDKANAECEVRYVGLIYQAAKEDPFYAWKMLMSGRFPRWKSTGQPETDYGEGDGTGTEDIDAVRNKLTRRLLKLQGLPVDALERIPADKFDDSME